MKYINENPTKTEKILFEKYGLYLIYKDEDSYRYAPIHIKKKTTSRKGKSDMINEKRLKKELQKRFDAFVRKCGMADDMKSYGYASCYDDVSDIIEQLAAQNDIERLSHYIYSHLCKYRPLKGLLKSVNIQVGKKLKLR